jgi:arsenate reductase
MAHIKRRVLFLCNGNSCRSQIAEAIVNTQLSEDWQAFSAGVQPTGFIHPFSLRVLTEIGISHEGRSKSVDEFRNQSFDVVITLCD